MSDIAFKKVGGIQTTITEHGEFKAIVGDVFLCKATFEQLRVAIESELKMEAKKVALGLNCVCLVEYDGVYCVEDRVLDGLNRSSSELKWREAAKEKPEISLPLTKENRAVLVRYAEAKGTLTVLGKLIGPRKLEGSRYGGRIDASEYPQRAANLKSAYERSLAIKGGE